MNNKTVAIIVSAVAACIVCIVAVLTVKMHADDSPAIDIQPGTYEEYQSMPDYTFPVYNDFTFGENETSETATGIVQPSVIPSVSVSAETSAAPDLPGVTGQETTTLAETVTQLATVINQEFSQIFKMPKAPKYIPPDSDIDFDTASIASYKYDPDGNYYYTDDKNAWQSNFGFNEGYDSMAPVTMMFYDTVRTKFVYDNKEWLIQIWKGQYGYAFVGGEVGVYTRKVGSGGTHFNCAKKEDWLKMEMCFMWDEYQTGEYKPVFNRPYADYWWCTGFVVGFDGGENRKQFRLVTHITFKDTEMANAFCEAFEANGFTRVSSLDSNDLDCFVQSGADVGFVWQNIDQ